MPDKKNIPIYDLKGAMWSNNPPKGLKIYEFEPTTNNNKYPNFYYDVSDQEEIKRISDLNTQRGYSLQTGVPPAYSSDLIESDYFISGIVLAHFTFPIVDMKYPEDNRSMITNESNRTSKNEESIQSEEEDEEVSLFPTIEGVVQEGLSFYPEEKPEIPTFIWEGVQYGEYYSPNGASRPPTLNRGSHDLIFIQDISSQDGNTKRLNNCIAVLNTQFYGNSYVDQSMPPNVDSAYIPSRYHIKVGDIIEIYSGNLVRQSFVNEWSPKYNDNREFNRDEVQSWIRNWSNNNDKTKIYLSLTEPMMYRVIPNNSYTPVDTNTSWEKNKLNGRIKSDSFLPKPISISIPLLGSSAEGSLVKIRRVKLRVPMDKNSKVKTIFLEPGKLYEVVDTSGNISFFRVCHGTDIAKVMPEISIDKQFDLVGIVAGPNRSPVGEGFEIWPRTIYDLGIGGEQTSDTTSNLIDTINSI